ncbi:phosphatases II [Panus rudis PR-1116 ss-1]|nr:phosphatases II [Panus rudis PR-1116 ss-1]
MGSTLLNPLVMPSKHKSKPSPTVRTSLSSLDTSAFYSSAPSPNSYYTSSRHPPPQPPTEIVPRLFVSDISAAESSSTLRSLGITHILSAMPGMVAVPRNPNLHHFQIPLQDNPFAELAAHLPQATAFISDALRDPQARVLVHCVQGISRSTSVVCAYLIAQYGWTPAQAVQYIKSKRSLADPNPGFVSQLGEFAESLRGSSGSNRAVHDPNAASRWAPKSRFPPS